jgi:uncharacterized protein YhfF
MSNPAAAAYWARFIGKTRLDLENGRYVVATFGDSAALADELLGLVLAGPKRASASLALDYQRADSDPFPAVGDYVVWLDGSGRPRCITRTSSVEVKPLLQVDEAFAWDEDEGDRTRAWWLAVHRRYFARQAERQGFFMHDDIATVFERFWVT